MELRHLRCFLIVAEELHFARAAERLHIDQSPLSRTIKELEEELGARLFIRTTRSTQLTRAGRQLLEHVPRIFTALDQARDGVKSATNGFCGLLQAHSGCIEPGTVHRAQSSRYGIHVSLCLNGCEDVQSGGIHLPAVLLVTRCKLLR